MLDIKMRATLLGILALFIVSGIAASTASAAGPYWHVNGTRLEKGTHQIKDQLKGKIVMVDNTLSLELTCNESISEGATIEGNGTLQGQGKGRASFTSCEVIKPTNCKVAEPIVINPVKSYLAVNEGTQQNLVIVFEPTEGTVFVNLKFSGTGCGVVAGTQPVKGSVYAELVPKEGEGQEGLLNFPTAPVAKVKHEGVETKVGLTVATSEAVFRGAYGARLAIFPETLGVFLN